MSKNIEQVDFSLIRYSNVWEDANVLLNGLQMKGGERVLSIASAGDNAFALLTANPEIVVAFDISSPQLHLVELKKCAIQNLTREQCLQFLGFMPCEHRLKLYAEIEHCLNPEAKQYWQNHLEGIERGIIHEGKFEKYFQLFSQRVLPFIHSRQKVKELFRPKSQEEQKLFFDKKWNTWRWRLLFKLFFSKWFMGKKGRDKAFLTEVAINVGNEIFRRAEVHLSSTECQSNGMLYYIMTGSYGPFLPFYLKEENYDTIQQNLSKLHLFQGFPNEAIDKFGTFDAFNLSDIFEYMNESTFQESIDSLQKGANQQAKFAYWNLLVDRRISKVNSTDFEFMRESSESLSSIDNGFFYGCFIIDKKLS